MSLDKQTVLACMSQVCDGCKNNYPLIPAEHATKYTKYLHKNDRLISSKRVAQTAKYLHKNGKRLTICFAEALLDLIENEKMKTTKTHVEEFDPIIDVTIDINELNAWIGKLREYEVDDEDIGYPELLQKVQSDLFQIIAEFNGAEPKINQNDIKQIEDVIEKIEKILPELKGYLLPSHPSDIHIARAVCHRAIRSADKFITLLKYKKTKCSECVLPYLNRLSDFLFVFARLINYDIGSEEVWNGKNV